MERSGMRMRLVAKTIPTMRTPEFLVAGPRLTMPVAGRMSVDRLTLQGRQDWRGAVVGLADEGLALHRGIEHVAERRGQRSRFWLDANLEMGDLFARIHQSLPAVEKLLHDPNLSRGAMRLRQLSVDGAWNSEYLALNAAPGNALRDGFRLQGQLMREIRELAASLR